MAKKRKQPAYMGRPVAPLSDGRTVGVCSWCGKQHPGNSSIEHEATRGCFAPDSVLAPRPRP